MSFTMLQLQQHEQELNSCGQKS